jgi:hypothetical protein
MPTVENATLAQGVLDAFLFKDGLLADSLIAQDLRHDFSRGRIEVSLTGEHAPAAMAQVAAAADVKIDLAIGSDDLRCVHMTYKLTGEACGGIAGKTADVTAIIMVRVEDDKIVQVWHEHSVLSALLELGYTLTRPSS